MCVCVCVCVCARAYYSNVCSRALHCCMNPYGTVELNTFIVTTLLWWIALNGVSQGCLVQTLTAVAPAKGRIDYRLTSPTPIFFFLISMLSTCTIFVIWWLIMIDILGTTVLDDWAAMLCIFLESSGGGVTF